MHTATYAEQRLEWLDEGRMYGLVTVDRFTLVLPPNAWPPDIRLEYTVDGEPRGEEGPELTITPDWPPRAAADFWWGVTVALWD